MEATIIQGMDQGQIIYARENHIHSLPGHLREYQGQAWYEGKEFALWKIPHYWGYV